MEAKMTDLISQASPVSQIRKPGKRQKCSAHTVTSWPWTPLVYFEFAQKYMLLFASQILAVPGFVLHVNSMMNEVYDSVLRERLCTKTVLILYECPNELDSLVASLDGSYVLCFIANLIQLSLLEGEILAVHCSQFCRDKVSMYLYHPPLSFGSEPSKWKF
ncbi:unnamed protein product [Echinostoma caproni]|uniref:UDENN domain-containing protein n=1 Tax=Echinostoma caproni TaxID=27848 RepID=A0A183AXZ0_9TREM|nr:unnamed protein product [Echinostoma caproni]